MLMQTNGQKDDSMKQRVLTIAALFSLCPLAAAHFILPLFHKVGRCVRLRIIQSTAHLSQLALAPSVALQTDFTGAMFRANLQHTGVYQTKGVRKLHGVKWKFKTERVIEAWFSSPTVADGVVYVGSDDGYLYAIDAQTGAQRWRFKTGDVVYSSPAVAAGTVYVGSHDGHLYAVDGATGTEKWSFKTGYRVYSSPAVADGKVYFGSADSCFCAVDATIGQLK